MDRRSDRRFTRTNRKYELKQLWDLHLTMLRKVAAGKSNVQVAEELGITPQTVSNTRNSALGRARLQELQQSADASLFAMQERIQAFAPRALEVLEDIIAGEGEGSSATLELRARCASAHLGRAGLGEIKKVAAPSQTLTRDDIERIKARALDSAREQGLVHDLKQVSENAYA
jgi:Bacterial regulatory proteins, luxR family